MGTGRGKKSIGWQVTLVRHSSVMTGDELTVNCIDMVFALCCSVSVFKLTTRNDAEQKHVHNPFLLFKFRAKTSTVLKFVLCLFNLLNFFSCYITLFSTNIAF